ncbi:S8 family serine peptidase [Pelagibius marinus]|uniref:S8 family serine peptidase n=1 Tax=Pelagibius marinus TaxID=2762760 RepID=UPI001872B0B7|nr:S8 family serine peptidase [Pelagibius marinus]
MAAARADRLSRLRGGLLGGLLVAALAAVLPAQNTARAQSSTSAAQQPVIMGIGHTGCLEFGDRVKVRGRHLGRAAGRLLVIRDPNISIALPVSSWNNRVIRATLPKSKKLERGKWYVLGIQEARTGNWLSGQGRPVQICEQADTPGIDKNNSAQVDPGADRGKGRDPLGREPEPRRPAGSSTTPPQGAQPQPGTPLPPANQPAATNPDIVPDEVLAITASIADATALAQQLANLGYAVRSLQELPALGFALLRLGVPGGQDVPAALDSLRQTFPATLFDANTLYEPDAASQTGAAPRHYAKALIGWPDEKHACETSVYVGLIDTAVDIGHEALADRQVTVRSFIAGGVPPAPPDHGTAVAAIIVGAPGTSSSGLLPAARLFAAGIFSLRDDNRIVGTTDAIARSVDWLGQQGVRVVNLSLSGPGNQVMRLTVERAHQSGMVLVAAAGNEGPNAAPVYPAGYAPVVAVTAVDAALQPYSEANHGDYVDLAAPGVDVWSARGGKGGRYNSGTSFAAPFVSAAAALSLSKTPDAPPQAIRESLQQSARDLGTPGRDSTFGWGLLQPTGGC